MSEAQRAAGQRRLERIQAKWDHDAQRVLFSHVSRAGWHVEWETGEPWLIFPAELVNRAVEYLVPDPTTERPKQTYEEWFVSSTALIEEQRQRHG